MKKFAIAIICLLSVVAVRSLYAEDYRVLTFKVDNVSTSTTAVVDTKKGLTGQPVAFAFEGGTNMVVSLSTVVGYGLSLNAAKDLYAGAGVTNTTFQTNIATTIYLANDRVAMSAYSAGSNEAFNCTGRLLIKE